MGRVFRLILDHSKLVQLGRKSNPSRWVAVVIPQRPPAMGRDYGGTQQGSDAQCDGEGCPADAEVSWEEMFGIVQVPRQNDTSVPCGRSVDIGTDTAGRSTESGTDTADACSGYPCIAAPGISAAVGTELGVEAGVQAELPGQADPSAVATLARLPPADKERVDNFLRVLKLANPSADGQIGTGFTVDALLRLIRTLPAPEGPRALLAVIKAEHPALFARLHDSMLRTQQRLAASAGPQQASAPEVPLDWDSRMRPTPSLPLNCAD